MIESDLSHKLIDHSHSKCLPAPYISISRLLKKDVVYEAFGYVLATVDNGWEQWIIHCYKAMLYIITEIHTPL